MHDNKYNIAVGDKVRFHEGSLFAIPSESVGQVLELHAGCAVVELEKTHSHWYNPLGEAFHGKRWFVPLMYLEVQSTEVNWIKEMQEALEYLQGELDNAEQLLEANEDLRSRQFEMIQQLTDALAEKDKQLNQRSWRIK